MSFILNICKIFNNSSYGDRGGKMDWNNLLSRKRLGIKSEDTEKQDNEDKHPSFQRDFNRIIFSSAFRRLQDKTQVFPLATTDFVRTRLTHSLESSSVGRSLGSIAGNSLPEKYKLPNDIQSSDLGTIVATACLAHDIGNPPLGHAGEEAIRSFFINNYKRKEKLNENELADLEKFEGNAQGFRILTRLQYPENKGGLNLTYATLAAFLKYPTSSLDTLSTEDKDVSKEFSYKKHGFFNFDKEFFDEVVGEVGLVKRKNSEYARHPLAFLVEAADDICYRIVDFEDSYRFKLIDFDNVYSSLHAIAGCNDEFYSFKKLSKNLEDIKDKDRKIEYLRAKSIHVLIHKAVDVFIENIDKIMTGEFNSDLVSDIKNENIEKALNAIEKESIKYAYHSLGVLDVEIVGFKVIPELLRIFLEASNDACEKGGIEKSSSVNKRILLRFPQLLNEQDVKKGISEYERILKVTDFISGMSDSFAVSVYKKLSGMSLPGM